jgi:predicted nucleic acid-binding protein
MALYVDTSALLKRYVEEPDSERAERYLQGDVAWLSGRHTYVEARRNLARAVAGEELVRLREALEEDWRRITVIELDEITCRLAADLAEQTGLRSLDALHLGAALRVGPDSASILTFDIRQAQAARQLGFVVIGV